MKILPALLGLMLLLPAACQAAERPALSENGLALIPLTITTAQGKTHRFSVEVAASEAQQERGLMFRATLAPDAGMIFPMSPPRYASFWMKNTIIPLDMIFIRPDGSIARIAAKTTPFSLLPVDSGEPVAAVLELAGGRSAALGLAEGDKVIWKRR
jgi:hypothetical protein